MTPDDGGCSARRRKLFLCADEAGLDRDERIALAEMLLRRDIDSWADLDDTQVCRLLDALEGHHLIGELYAQRPPTDASAAEGRNGAAPAEAGRQGGDHPEGQRNDGAGTDDRSVVPIEGPESKG